jgi:CBS domain-containing protein
MFNLDAIMTTDLVTISPSASLASARTLMREHRIRHLPVVRGESELVGLLTQTDVLSAADSVLRDREDRLPTQEFPVEDIMVTDISTVDETASLRQAALYLERNRIGCLPVVSGKQLVGIVTDTDFVGVAINLLEQAEELEPPEVEFD